MDGFCAISMACDIQIKTKLQRYILIYLCHVYQAIKCLLICGTLLSSNLISLAFAL